MRIKQLYFFFLINSFIVLGQNNDIVIKVFLEDAYTAKNVKDAKVTLEGFEMPEIVGKYDSKGGFYYFTEIPEGYNTIMSYHKTYNEKGFQDVNGLPKKIKLSLKKRDHNFLVLPDSFYSEEKKELIKKYEYYVEDPYKIVIDIDIDMSYEQKREYLNNFIKDQNLSIEMVNPFFEKDKMIYNDDYNVFNFFVATQNEGYPDKFIYDKNDSQILPLYSGMNTMDVLFDEKRSDISEEICFIFRKSNGSKFKRYNDPIISKIKKMKLSVFSILLYKRNDDIDPIPFKNYKIRDKLNKIFNNKYIIDSSKVFFYDNKIRNKTKYALRKEKKILLPYEPTSPDINHSFILIKSDNYNIFKYYPGEILFEYFNFDKKDEVEIKEKIKIPKQEISIGLGILDQYEYYANEHSQE